MRAFKAIFQLCKSNAIEINKAQKGIEELQAHAGLPHSPIREPPTFEDPWSDFESEEHVPSPSPGADVGTSSRCPRRSTRRTQEIESDEEEEVYKGDGVYTDDDDDGVDSEDDETTP
ncbi:hypothetical protein OsI_24610 [Oryza sativa Indica Group]|uniref:Uncharacterized protein n=1 Tax=Oryza sativa subsp. indica TaxID=39946 RepID=A2YHE4_ORYSI|nr:hypothetical protein OsI_24610 [Oryza sativa Indica Group]